MIVLIGNYTFFYEITLNYFYEQHIKMMLKFPVLLRGYEKILRNLLKCVQKSISNFPVPLESYFDNISITTHVFILKKG